MTKKAAFKAVCKAIGFSEDASTKLTNTEFVNSMPKLSCITYARASKICKAIRSPGGGGRGGTCHRRGGAQYCDCSGCALNASRVSRTIECAEIRLDPSDLFDLHEGRKILEGKWVNKEWADAFRPLSENDLKKGWKFL